MYPSRERFERVFVLPGFSLESLTASRVVVSHGSSSQLDNLACFLCGWIQ